MRIEGDKLVMSTGREFYAHRGVVGLGPDRLVSHGYDGDIPAWPEPWWPVIDLYMTEAERQELADYMIAAWTAFKSATNPNEQEKTE